MRVPIAVQVKPFDFEKAQPQIDATREEFAGYLDEFHRVSRKSTRSKHGLMGPVGKILSEVKSGRRDAASLKGYAVRVHEATGRNPSPAGLQALEQGIDYLVKLLSEAPITVHDRLLDRLDYGLYYDLRKKALQSKEARRQAWIKFLRDKYGSEAKLSEAWGEEVGSFDELYLPRKAEGSKTKKAKTKQQDIAAFWESQGASTVIEKEED
ncbi:MAG: hypothetical protein C4534_03455 [Gaiellales bacterium]|nr:MAG: hypothetical protein C4534_03455 [Gaiellales bacterium]